MDIFLTVDVESYTGDYDVEIYGQGQGLAYILEVCRRFGIQVTFFVEALGATQWGISPVKQICDMIYSAGQDIELHIHPVAAKIEGFEDHDDILWNYDRETQERLINVGLNVLRECGVKEVTSLRVGDFAANEDTLKAMNSCKVKIGSNRDMDLKCSTRSRLNDSFPVKNDISKKEGIIDLPVTTLRSSLPLLDGLYRHMEISAMGLGEMCDGLLRMANAGYSCAVILTHPAEFFRNVNGVARIIAKNRRRLEGLLQFLNRRKDLRMLGMKDCIKKSMLAVYQPPEIRSNLFLSVLRICEQALYRMQR